MDFNFRIDHSVGRRGRVAIELMDDDRDVVDREIVFKHPFLLRIRMRLAMRRIKARQRKMEKIRKRFG